MKILKSIRIAFIALFFAGITLTSFAISPPPPPPDPSGGGSNGPVGGGASLANGFTILVIMGAIYGGRKLYLVRKKPIENQ